MYGTWRRKYYEDINTRSRTDAIGWSWLISGFQDTKVPPDSLLPVIIKADGINLPNGYSKPTQETIDILKRNIEAGKVPRKVMIALATDNILLQLMKND